MALCWLGSLQASAGRVGSAAAGGLVLPVAVFVVVDQ